MIRFYLDGQPCEPYNRTDIKYSIDYSQRRRLSEFEINIDVLEFVREDYERIFNWLKTYGRYQGMPLDVQFSNGLVQQYYLDFSDPAMTWTETNVTVKVKRRNATINFFDDADSLIFDLVNNRGKFQPSDFTNVDYIIIPPNREIYFITISQLTYKLAIQLAESIKQAKEAIAKAIEASTPVGVPPVPNLGAIIAKAIIATAKVVYTVAVGIALIRLVSDLIKLISPPVRQFKAISYRNLIKRGCEALGYTLQSNVLDDLSNLVVLPVPLRPNNFSVIREVFAPQSIAFTNGYPSSLDVIPTLGTAISTLEEILNLTTIVNEKVVRIERSDAFNQVDSDPIPLAYNLQNQKQEERKFNDELWKRKLMFWAKDGADFNTFDDRTGTIVEFDTSVQVSPHPDIQLLRGLEQVPTNFARGTRKDGLDFIEKTLKVLVSAVDLFVGGALSNQINNRVGVMIVSQQYYSVTKLLWMQGTKISAQDKNVLDPENIINNYHQNLRVVNNTTEVIENMPVRMDELNFLQFVNKNFVTLSSGETAELKFLEWSENDHEASATIELDSDYAVNINETKVNNG